MLLKLRGGLDSIFVTILLAVLIAAFAIWGIGPNMLSGNIRNVAVVGETEIPAQQFSNMVQRRAQQMQQQFGGAIPADRIISMMNLDMQILGQMTAEAALTEKMRDMGLRATPEQVVEELHQLDAFMSPDGSFSRVAMNQALRNANVTEKELLDDLRGAITRGQFLQSLAAGQTVPRALAENLYIWQAERRRAAMINFAATDIKDIEAPADDVLLAYYEANKAQYMTTERRSYNYIILTPEQYVDQVVLEDGELEAAYENRRDDYVKPELRAVNLVSFSDKEAADAFVADVVAGKDFVTTAAAATDFTAAEIGLGDQARSDLVTDFDEATAAAIFDAAINVPVGPIEGLAGFNVFQVASVTAGAAHSLDDVRDELTAEIKKDHAVGLMYDALPNVQDALLANGSLTAVAEAMQLNLASVSGVDQQGNGPDGRPVVTQQNEYIIMQDAFRREQGAEAELVDLNPQDAAEGTYLVEVTDVAAPKERLFEEVSTDLRAAWIKEQQQIKAGELAEQAKSRLLAGDDAETVAAELGGVSFEAKNVTRTGDTSSSLSSNIRRLIFDLPVGKADSERAADGNGYVVVRIDSVVPGEPAVHVTEVDALLAQMQEQASNELYGQLQAYLMTQYEPDYNMALVRTLFPRDAAE